MQRPACIVLLAGLAGLPAAYAQTAAPRIERHVAAGYAAPGGSTGDAFEPGWAISGGATIHFDAARRLGLRLDLGFGRFEAERRHDEPLPAIGSSRVEDGFSAVESLSIGASYEFGGRGRFGVTVAAGIAAYSRYRLIDRTVVVPVPCTDPFPPCLVGAAEERVSESDRLTRPGADLGVALAFPVRPGGAVTLEGRYEWMDCEPSFRYVPILVGYRW